MMDWLFEESVWTRIDTFCQIQAYLALLMGFILSELDGHTLMVRIYYPRIGLYYPICVIELFKFTNEEFTPTNHLRTACYRLRCVSLYSELCLLLMIAYHRSTFFIFTYITNKMPLFYNLLCTNIGTASRTMFVH